MIGVFDSGSGGLTVLRQIRERLPIADVVYLADLANMPFGNKTQEELVEITLAGVARLVREGVDKIVLACNSVSVSKITPLLSNLFSEKIEVVEMVGPTVEKLASEKRKIYLVATEATVKSKIYQREFEKEGKEITALAIADLAYLVENGASRRKIKEAIRQTLSLIKGSNDGVLILGCTHFPLVWSEFEEVLGDLGLTLEIYDPAVAVAERVVGERGGRGIVRYLTTKESDIFVKWVRQVMG